MQPKSSGPRLHFHFNVLCVVRRGALLLDRHKPSLTARLSLSLIRYTLTVCFLVTESHRAESTTASLSPPETKTLTASFFFFTSLSIHQSQIRLSVQVRI
ncbi:uncharacterized protein G2W53_029787 [Senna tora]|uniref:Uncharacterized protein n=1 Tax=Senna tora TaxID=362788 RepID=A0A834T663_9FABA|nr:uncharacterized protein G2W53_029787 [Senna tora]